MVAEANVIVQVALVIGTVHALVPRSMRWQLQLAGVRSAIIGASAVVNSVLLGSLNPLRVFLLYWTAPFLLTYLEFASIIL